MPIDVNPAAEHAAVEFAEDEKRRASEPQEKGLSTPLRVLPVAANAADALTTAIALGKPGLEEGNPTLKKLGPAGIAAAKLGVGVGMSALANKVAKKHKLAGKLVAIAPSVIAGAAALNNIKQISGRKK